MKHNYKFGIIGCGTISSFYADAIAALDRAVLSGIYDVRETAGQAFSEKYGAPFYKCLEDFLNSDVEVVCICTPSGLHAEYVKAAAAAGKHLVVEKPMGISREQLEDIVAACDRYGVKLCAISQLLFSDAYQRVKEAVDSGKLGRLILGSIVMKYYRDEDYYRAGGWRGTKRMDGGGALMNQGIHGVHMLQYLMGPVKSVTALARTQVHQIEVEDTAAALLEFKSGALGYVVGTTSVLPGQPRVLEVHGTKGTISMTEDQITSWHIQGEKNPELVATQKISGTANHLTAFSAENHTRQLADLIEALDSGRSPKLDQYEGCKPVELILAAYRSSETGKTIYFE